VTPKTLHIATDLTFPLDAVTQTFLIVGKRGSGKSNTAARFVEQLHRAKLPFVVLDPVDTWWGLKAARRRPRAGRLRLRRPERGPAARAGRRRADRGGPVRAPDADGAVGQAPVGPRAQRRSW
jgi:DNA helicase HerA-like ATPase